MTASETTKPAGPGFFTIYKPGQGKFVRWGTVVAIVLITSLGMYWIYASVIPSIYSGFRMAASTATQPADAPKLSGGEVGSSETIVTVIVLSIFGLIGVFLAYMSANRPRPAEFMIMTESEMRKVTWPSRQTVIASTKVVIFLTILLAVILAGVDAGCIKLFHWLKIL